MSDAGTAVGAIIARDGLTRLTDDDRERLVALYDEILREQVQLRSLPHLRGSEPAVVFSAG